MIYDGITCMKKSDSNDFEIYNFEAQKRWGETEAYREYKEKTESYDGARWDKLADGMNSIFAEFSLCVKSGEKPDSPQAKSLVRKLQSYITANCYKCTDEILAGLGQMYVLDERFKNNIDNQGEGTAKFVSNAIANLLNEKESVI